MYIYVVDVNKDWICFLFGVLRPAKHKRRWDHNILQEAHTSWKTRVEVANAGKTMMFHERSKLFRKYPKSPVFDHSNYRLFEKVPGVPVTSNNRGLTVYRLYIRWNFLSNKDDTDEPSAASSWNCIMGLHIKRFLWIITRTHRRTNQDEKWFMHASASCFTLGCLWNKPVHEIMVPLAHATSEGSNEPAHPHSLARGINAHIQGM